MVLIEELLEKLRCRETELSQTKLDLENECEGRRRLQQAAQENREWKERQERRPFVVALIDADADGYVFHDNFITKGEKGGEDAADTLLATLQKYMQEVTGASNGMDILVKAFANVSGLGSALERDGRLQNASQLREFATGFSNRRAFFDFVDVGTGKERADLKIQENVKFFVESFQCKHLVVACGHDTGYAPFLGQLIGDKQVAERITLLEGSPFPKVIRDLGFKKTQFRSVFNDFNPPAMSAGLDGPVWGRGLPSTLMTSSVGRPINPRPGMFGRSGTSPNPYLNPKAQIVRLGPVIKDKDGHRIDKPLSVDKVVVERMKKESLCYYLFLRGECVIQDCRRNHVHQPLSNEEFDGLWCLARQSRCYTNRKSNRDARNDCSDARCVYGHRGGAE